MLNGENIKIMSNFNCIICKKEIVTLFPEQFDIKNFNSNMWEGGLVIKTTGPYGSRFDSETIIIGVCDDCIEQHCEIIKN